MKKLENIFCVSTEFPWYKKILLKDKLKLKQKGLYEVRVIYRGNMRPSEWLMEAFPRKQKQGNTKVKD